MAFEQRLRGEQVVGIAIIEGHGNGAARNCSILKVIDQMSQRKDGGVSCQHVEVLLEMQRANGKSPRIDV